MTSIAPPGQPAAGSNGNSTGTGPTPDGVTYCTAPLRSSIVTAPTVDGPARMIANTHTAVAAAGLRRRGRRIARANASVPFGQGWIKPVGRARRGR